MNFYEQKQYVEFFAYIDNLIKTSSNGLVVSLPGMGTSFLIKNYLANNKNKVDYFPFVPNKLSKNHTFIKYDSNDVLFLSKIDQLLKANIEKKIVLCLSLPNILDTPEYQKSYFALCTYSVHYLHVASFDSCKEICLRVNSKTNTKEIDKIYEISGGIVKIIKFLAVNREIVDDLPEKLSKYPDLLNIIDPILKAIQNCSDDTLKIIGVSKNNVLLSRLPINKTVEIKLDLGLSFKERLQTNPNRLTPLEKRIIESLVANNFFVSKEQISDIKWGDGKYDDYSDQAINKTMRRLSKKFLYHKIETITKLGFQMMAI